MINIISDTIEGWFVSFPRYELTAAQKKTFIGKRFEAKSLGKSNDMTPCVYAAKTLSGRLQIGVCYQPKGTPMGHLFHYDHGVGIHRNQDACVIWI